MGGGGGAVGRSGVRASGRVSECVWVGVGGGGWWVVGSRRWGLG